jgi:hypothetical protein
MPKGMILKSFRFASNLYDPKVEVTVQQFRAERGIPYDDLCVRYA